MITTPTDLKRTLSGMKRAITVLKWAFSGLKMDHLRLETGLLRYETNIRLMLTYIVVVVVVGQELCISSWDQSSDCLVSSVVRQSSRRDTRNIRRRWTNETRVVTHIGLPTYYGFQTVCKCPFRALLVTSETDSNQTWTKLSLRVYI